VKKPNSNLLTGKQDFLKDRYMDLNKWTNVTETFSEDQRHYSNTYLEICEVYEGKLEVSLFSSKVESYEIYFSFGIMYGIIYVEKENAVLKYEEVKKELELEYHQHKEPTKEFINEFGEKHKVCLPNDIFFDASGLFE